MIKIKDYKGVELFYCEDNGKINFSFEGVEREVKYIFEAIEIIDEPIWEVCELQGFFVDGYFDKYIGLAKADKKNIKTNKPYWKFKGQYDVSYKDAGYTSDKQVFLRSKENDIVYKKWQEQKEIFNNEMQKLNNITAGLKAN